MSAAARYARLVFALLLIALALFVTAQQQQQQPAYERPQPPETKYEVIVPGMVANTPLTLQFRSADLRLVVRDLIMGRGEARNVPVPARIVMELRGGGVTTTIDGAKAERTQGDIWTVEKGQSLTVQNPYDVAVIRAMYVFERGQ
jgi:hypothetical protein